MRGGGFAYLLGPELLRSCGLMYLSMQSFFEMNCIQLEYTFIGLAAQGSCISAKSFEDSSYVNQGLGRYPHVAFAALPGLQRKC